MANKRIRTLLCGTVLLLGACGPLLEEQRLSIERPSGGQEAPKIRAEALTLETARLLNSAGFERIVQRGGLGKSANAVDEAAVLRITAPPTTRPIPYRIGVGDDIELVIFQTQRGLADQAQESVATRSARVSADGVALFIETGTLDLRGKTLQEAREQAANALIRNGIDPRFQLEVRGFNSQKVNLTLIGSSSQNAVSVSVDNGVKGTGSYPITERPMTIKELLVSAGLELSRSGVQVVSLDRAGRRYEMPVEYLFAPGSPDYFLTGGDTVRVEEFTYRTEKAFILGGGAAAVAFEITPEARPTLADILFVEGGPFATKSARNSEIYLLRGSEPVVAYHLDAGDPSRILTAAETELRPNDVVFLTSKPIYALNDLIAAVNPVTVLAREASQ